MSNRITRALRALHELGFHQVFSYAQYKISLKSGLLARLVRGDLRQADVPPGALADGLLMLPSRDALQAAMGQAALQTLFSEADAICAGQVKLFGSLVLPLQFSASAPLKDWTAYADLAWLGGTAPEGDIKFTWEPARFGWAIILARAYWLSRDERYASAFWQWSEDFFSANPPGFGPHWASAQEVGLRLICLVFAWQVFAASQAATNARSSLLARQIAQHAARIPASLSYARAQNNNHLLSETAALYTAGLALPTHPLAPTWRRLGWQNFHAGLRQQIAADGSYSQHSTNYHRLMLQLALWVNALSRQANQSWPADTHRLAGKATAWMSALTDPTSGCLPNLGPNDGAYILPLTSAPFADYRPAQQAAGRVFLPSPSLTPAPVEEMSLWLASHTDTNRRSEPPYPPQGILQSPSGASWAYLRAVHFEGRPGHADQLHVDLWWRGLNIALDPGTYLYNAPPPWDNALACAQVHNTVTLNGHDQMYRAGRFLYLQPAQAEYTEHLVSPDQRWERLTARQTGYLRLPVPHRALHVRTLARLDENWQVEDQILPMGAAPTGTTQVRLHWLLPDWPWQIENQNGSLHLFLAAPGGQIELQIAAQVNSTPVEGSFLLARAGERAAGQGTPALTWGWHSPTYGVKLPALSLGFTIEAPLPVTFTSRWLLPER